MASAVITGSIIAAHKREEQKAKQTLPQYLYNGIGSQPSSKEELNKRMDFFTRQVSPIRFCMGWKEDLDDATLRISKIQTDANATDWWNEHATIAYRDVRDAERLGETRKDQTEILTTASGASFGSVLGPIGAAVAGFGGFLLGKVLGSDNKESAYLERLLTKSHGKQFKTGRAQILDNISNGISNHGTYHYYDRHGTRDTLIVSEQQARILRKITQNPSDADRQAAQAVLVELDAYKDIKKDPDYIQGRSKIEVPRACR